MSSIFGSSNTSTMGRFSNLNVNLPQQPMQQPQSSSTFQQQQQQMHTQPLVNAGSTSQSYENSNEGTKTSWFNNPRKRTIPQSIVKRSAKPGSPEGTATGGNSGAGSGNRSGFGTIAFGTSKSSSIFNTTNAAADPKDSLPNAILIDSNEAPPTKSIYDWQREDEFGTTLPATHPENAVQSHSLGTANNLKASVNRNVFDKGSIVSNTSNEAEEAGNSAKSFQRSESAVIVFGYPESISNQIIIHFSKFGNILEDFEALRGASGINAATLRLRNKHENESTPRRKYPIFTGDGWIKLTYDSPSTALRALQENGVVYGGCLIGCVPYTKSAVEQLASCKIDKSDDIGGFSIPSNAVPSSNLNSASLMTSLRNDKEADASLSDDKSGFFVPSRRLDMKDGKELFVHNGPNAGNNHNFLKSIESKMQEHQSENQRSNGVIGKVNSWLFGWNDL